MNREILLIAEQLKDTYEGTPWFGRNIKEILNEIDESIVSEKPNGQHSILELLWHMITWKEFTINRLRNEDTDLQYFEKNDWRKLEHGDNSLWRKGLELFEQLHSELLEVVQQQKDELLSRTVEGKNYDFRKLLYGAVDHDIYHLGQAAYLKKMLKGE